MLGGARSGKSAHAEGLLPADERVRYLATATARAVERDADEEWSARIALHRASRPSNWVTLETPDVAGVIGESGGTDPPLLVDDVTNWLTGALDDCGAWGGGSAELAAVRRRVDELVTAVAGSRCRLVLVSGEVGLGIVPATRSGRLFRDELGRCNAALAQVCDEVVLLVAGIPLRLR